MSNTLKHIAVDRVRKSLKKGLTPVKLVCVPKGNSLVEFSDGSKANSACIACKNPRCIQFENSELIPSILKDFPADKSDMVCPTNAITWDESEVPIIDKSKCISCGLCVVRCPTGAISFDENNKAVITPTSEAFEVNLESHDGTLALFQKIEKSGILAEENDTALERLLENLENAYKTSGSQHTNILARNLLMMLGYETHIRRRGDVYLRMDGVVSSGAGIGALEVEGGVEAILDAPRNILDDVAVLSARYGVDKSKAFGLVVSNTFANQRTEYWRVIDDIKAVLGIKIFTITVPALILLVWNLKKLDVQLYNTNAEECSIRKALTANLGRPINFTEGRLPLFEASK